jgi:hypothetical protein
LVLDERLSPPDGMTCFRYRTEPLALARHI